MTTPPVYFEWRIPLPNSATGALLLTATRTLTSEQWDFFMTVLAVMRPGLVADPVEMDEP